MIIMRRRRTRRRRTLTLPAQHFRLLQGVKAIAMASAQVLGKAEVEAAESLGEKWIEDASDCRDLLGFVVWHCLLLVVFVASCPFSVFCFVVDPS